MVDADARPFDTQYMTVSSKPGLLRVVVEVFVPLLLVGAAVLSLFTYNLIALLAVPVGLWLLVRPHSEGALLAAFLLAVEVCLWLAVIFVSAAGSAHTGPGFPALTVLPSIVAALIAIGALGLLRAVRREQ